MGDSRVESWLGLTAPPRPAKESRFFKGKNLSPPGSLYSMAKPTKSRGGLPCFQFMATRAIPSPRCTLSVNSAAALWPLT
jgi:hypothetical protein